MRSVLSLVGGASLLLSLACSGGTPEQSAGPPSGSAGSSSDPPPPPPPPPGSVCGESRVGAPLLRRLNRDELLGTLNDVFPGVTGWTSALSADPISHHGFDNDASALVVGNQTADQLDRTADALGAAVAGSSLSSLLPCASTSKDAACAAEFVAKYGKRLFRRALSAEESGRYAALHQQVSASKGFEVGIRYVTRALVQSPHAVYRREVGVAEGGRYRLTPHEVATALAYDFTGTTPTEALLARAEQGQLATPAAREAVARELLATDRGVATVQKFFDSWLGYTRAASVTKSAVPQFEQLRQQMVDEARRFVHEVVVTQRGGLSELLTAQFTTPTRELAAFYGLPAPASDYAAVARPEGRGLGILAQGALLSARSGPAASSPTKRGLLVMERLLCRQAPAVPANIPELSAPMPGTFTTRQRYENLHAQGSCKACHSAFDPIGFGFEHFDEAGRYRDSDGGLPVDTSSYVPDGSGKLFEFETLDELARGLAAQQVTFECATGFMSTYVFGSDEACLGETRRSAFVDRELGFVDYLASLAAEPHFAERVAP